MTGSRSPCNQDFTCDCESTITHSFPLELISFSPTCIRTFMRFASFACVLGTFSSKLTPRSTLPNQEAYCVIDKNGFRFTVQKSNCLQANVYLKKELFTRFECEGNHQFGINLSLLLDCLQVFGTSSGNQIALQISYAGEGHPILLQMVDGDGHALSFPPPCPSLCLPVHSSADSPHPLRCSANACPKCLSQMLVPAFSLHVLGLQWPWRTWFLHVLVILLNPSISFLAV